MDYLEFVETPYFSKQRAMLLDDDSFRELQAYLLQHHEDGDTISKTGGCKKIRWSRPGMGKQGGVRIIYYAISRSGRLYLLTVYPKNAKDDLSESEKAILKSLIGNFN